MLAIGCGQDDAGGSSGGGGLGVSTPTGITIGSCAPSQRDASARSYETPMAARARRNDGPCVAQHKLCEPGRLLSEHDIGAVEREHKRPLRHHRDRA